MILHQIPKSVISRLQFNSLQFTPTPPSLPKSIQRFILFQGGKPELKRRLKARGWIGEGGAVQCAKLHNSCHWFLLCHVTDASPCRGGEISYWFQVDVWQGCPNLSRCMARMARMARMPRPTRSQEVVIHRYWRIWTQSRLTQNI